MWTCKNCGEQVDNALDACWRCSAPKGGRPVPPAKQTGPEWRLKYHVFRGTWTSWDELFGQAAELATHIGPERLVSISHSADRSDGVVVVWFWVPVGGAEQ